MSSLNPVSGSLGRRAANHLLRRLTFGPKSKQISELENKTIDQALDQLLRNYNHPEPPIDTATGKQWVSPAPVDRNTGNRINSLENVLIPYTRFWWMDTMVKENTGIIEKMVFFYHSHFTTMQSRIHTSLSLYHQLALFRHHALGNVKELARKMCLCNAMLLHLDGNDNEKDNPNENFAREFLELYTIGKGPQVSATDYTNYTEQDIKEAARVLSGFKKDTTFSLNIDPDTGVPLCRVIVNPQNMAIRHDSGEKRFSHRFGNRVIKPREVKSYYDLKNIATKEAAFDEVKDLVDMIFDQKETARHFCRKIYRFFVYHNITAEVERDIIGPLADTLYNNNYEMLPVLRKLFSSQHFYGKDNSTVADNVNGSIIKSPLDVVAGTLRYFSVQLPGRTDLPDYYNLYGELIKLMTMQGLELYEPFEVAGYAAYHQAPDYHRNWISSNNLARRYQFADNLLKGIRYKDTGRVIKLDIMKFVNDSNNVADPANAEQLVRTLVDDLLPETITETRFIYFLNEIFLDNLSVMNWKHEWENYKSSGKDDAVRMQLEKLVRAIIQTPEYQLF
jgi:uncharacterized protein (DUF1800 family)